MDRAFVRFTAYTQSVFALRITRGSQAQKHTHSSDCVMCCGRPLSYWVASIIVGATVNTQPHTYTPMYWSLLMHWCPVCHVPTLHHTLPRFFRLVSWKRITRGSSFCETLGVIRAIQRAATVLYPYTCVPLAESPVLRASGVQQLGRAFVRLTAFTQAVFALRI